MRSVCLTLSLLPAACWSFVAPKYHTQRLIILDETVLVRPTHAKKTEQEDEKGDDELNPIVKASWYAVEAFGKIFAPKGGSMTEPSGKDADDDEELDLSKPPSSLQETMDRIQLDNDRSYFLSGEVDKLIYDKDCVFADPFVSFQGRDRFVENLSNLGSFITKYSARMLSCDSTDSTVATKVSDFCSFSFFTNILNSKYFLKDHGQTGTQPTLETCASLAVGCSLHN